jgi:magnesium chelatase subunit D
MVEAVRASLPPEMLTKLAAASIAPRQSSGVAGSAQERLALHGRPAASRSGLPRGGARLDLLACLRAAAPWQRLRGAAPGDPPHLRVSGLKVRRHPQPAESVLIFVVDASGSAAAARRAEAKGAVELMLAEAYARREQVASISFRATGAEVLLPPTRALARAKRRLAELAGGGGTPLAAGLDAAAGLTTRLMRRGASPVMAPLTDERANVGLNGLGGRAGWRGRAGRDRRAGGFGRHRQPPPAAPSHPQPPARAGECAWRALSAAAARRCSVAVDGRGGGAARRGGAMTEP